MTVEGVESTRDKISETLDADEPPAADPTLRLADFERGEADT
jgi:hypothetical protein